MAQPIQFHPRPQEAAPGGERLREATAEHTEAILSAYELLQLLHERGILDLVRGLVGAGGDVMTAVAAAVDTPEAIRGIRNFLLLTQFFASIPPEVLISLVETARSGAEREKSQKAPGLFSLLWRLRNENSRHAAAVGLDLLEGLGKGL